MAYRNGTYVAFNGMGTTNPTEGDMKYYGLLQLWNESNNYDLSFSDSHKKTYSVKDSSEVTTLQNRLLERFRNSKHLLLIITENSSINRGLLGWEIEKAVEIYKLPIIVAYTGKETVSTPIYSLLPDELKKYMDAEMVKTIHIPFKREYIKDAVEKFSIHKMPTGLITTYKYG